MTDFRAHMARQYARSQAPAPRPLAYWLLLVLVVAGVTALLATVATHAAHRAALDTARPGHCFTTGC